MMQAFRLARNLYRSYELARNDIVGTLTALREHYGDESGVAHAAEVAPEQRAEFLELLRRCYEATCVFPAAPEPYIRPAPAPRSSWGREAFAPYSAVDEELDRALQSRPSGDAGQGSSSGQVREVAVPVDPPAPVVPEEEERVPEAEVRERSPPVKLSKTEGKRKAK